MFNTGAGTLKGKALARDPRVSFAFDDETPPFAFVLVDGTAEISEEPEALLHWATVIAGRYMGPDRAEAYGRRNAVSGELLVFVTPTKVRGMLGIAD